ncbi:MAG: AraC family transcriptional regulator [Pseudomonadales bacterium]|nr:AraC family transcriptional regulator [Pseudomonadales bacterium]
MSSKSWPPRLMFHNYSLDKRAIRMSQVSGTLEWAQRLGVSRSIALTGTGIDVTDLQDADARISYRQRIRQMENIIEHVPPGAWLMSRSEVSISDFGLLGYAMMSSATLDKAIQIAVKYHKMAGAMFELGFLRDGDDAVLRLDHMLAGGMVGQMVIDELFSGITPLIRLLTGNETFEPRELRFSFAKPSYHSLYARAFDCPIRFDEKYTEYRFDAALLAEPLAEADANTARICEESCRKLLNQMEIEQDIVSRICHLLLSTPGEFPRLDAIAEKLSIGTRTLRRRLKALGTSYQKILDDVKKELAIEYLQTTNLSVQEISDLLGYSEVTNFRRAFVKWVDVSPYQYRKRFEDASLRH